VSTEPGAIHPPIGAPENCTFREAALALELDDWSMEDLTYLEEPIGNRLMKARRALRTLDLRCNAGVTFVDNGTHRVVAAIAWNQRPGGTGMLQQAKTLLRQEIGGRVVALLDFAGHDDIEFLDTTSYDAHELRSALNFNCSYVVRRSGNKSNEMLCLPVESEQSVISKARQLRGSWHQVPSTVLEAWRNRGWVAPSVATMIPDPEPSFSVSAPSRQP